MPVKSTSRDPVFRTWNFAILTFAAILIALFSAELSAQPSRQTTTESTATNNTVGSGSVGTVATDGRRLNVRGGPGTGFAIVGKLEHDTQVQVLEASADGLWLNVRAPGVADSVWVAAEFIAAGTSVTTSAASVNSGSAGTSVADSPSVMDGTTAPAAQATAPAAAPTRRVSVQAVTTLFQNRPAATPAATSAAAQTGGTNEADSTGATPVATQTAGAEISLLTLLPTVTPTPVRAENSSTTAATGNTQIVLSPTATPAATSTPAATATPQPTPDVPTAFTQPPQMNVRGGPGTNFQVVRSVPAGTALQILAANPAGDWYQVDLGGDEPGWIFASLTQALGPLDTIARLNDDELPQLPAPPEPALAAAAAAPASAPETIAVSAPAPSGGAPFGYGVQAHMLGGGGDQSMAAVNDLGFNWIKQQVQWKLFEPSPGGRHFGELQGIVNAANSRGINVLFSVVDAPEWAREPGFDGGVGGPPQDPNTYAAFVGAMAGQFCGSSLKAIEVWNEQNLHYEWGNLPLNPADYMNLLRPAYAAIKAACPSMYVISGALTPAGSNPPFAIDDFQYLEGMYQHGLANYADGIGAHPSGYNVPPSVTWQGACEAIQTHGNSFNGACDSPHHSWSFRSTMEGYRNIMVTYGDANKKVWPTEFGWAAGGAFDPRYAYANDNSFEEQAAWTVEAYEMMRNWGWVGPAILWNLNFRVVADGTEKAQWGIVSNDWQPLPIYNALKGMPK